MIFKRYSNFLKEHALFNNDYDRYDNYFNDILDSKKTLQNINTEINLLIDLFKNLDDKKIKFNNNKYRDNENFEIKFSNEINYLIPPLIGLFDEAEEKNIDLYNKIKNLYFSNNEPNLSFDIQINRNNFNKFHFPIDLPPFLKNIGLGKKIIRSAVNKFDFLLFSKEEDSYELKLTVHSITQMNDLFSFMKDYNLMIIKDDFDIVKNILMKWFDFKYTNSSLDKDFLTKYGDKILNDDFLSKLYQCS